MTCIKSVAMGTIVSVNYLKIVFPYLGKNIKK